MQIAKQPHISVDVLHEKLDYTATTGVFVWKEGATSKGHKSRPAGTHDAKGYLVIKVCGKTYKASRVAWAMFYGSWPATDLSVDHINCNKADNRLENLRLSNPSENRRNNAGNSRTKSGLKGAYKHGTGYRSGICLNGKVKWLGQFSTALEAHQSYTDAANTHYGVFARSTANVKSTAGQDEREWRAV